MTTISLLRRRRAERRIREPLSKSTRVVAARSNRRRLLGLVGMFVALSLMATLSSQPGRYVADARLEQVTAPAQTLARQAYLWDDARSLGKPNSEFTPATSAFQTAVAATGAQPWLIERLTHALYLSLAGLGVILFVGAFRPRIGLAHALAAFVYAFSPFTSQFLLPSTLFLAYALAPWFAWTTLRGLRDGDEWRWAAALALAVAAFGALNAAALGFALVPAAVTALYVSVFEHRGLARLWRFTWRSGLLTLLTCSAAIVVMWFSAYEVSVNLRTTELPEIVARTSSWFESWRGLGMWLNYFVNPAAPDVLSPRAGPYFTSPVVMVASFVAPVAALVVLALGRWRHRLLFGSMLLVSLVLMVGIHGGEGASPFSRLLSFAFDNWEIARGFRATYKAGAGLMLAIAVLLGIGVASVARSRSQAPAGEPEARQPRSRRRGLAAGAAITVVLLGVIIASFPFWTGRLYDDQGFQQIPRYWTHAFNYLGAQEKPGRVLVLPDASRDQYRWGFVNDNIFDGFSPLSPLINQTLPQGTPESADLLAAIDQYVASPGYVRGTLAPILARLGVRWVLIQNDLDWQQMFNVPRPSAYDALRDDPGLRLAATFGSPGLNTSDAGDTSSDARTERSLPPVQLYEVAGKPSPRPQLAEGPPLLVAGGGDSWPSLAAVGLLHGPPVAYTGAASNDVLQRMVTSGSQVVVTDGNRKRATLATTGQPILSTTLAANESYRRPASDLFGGHGTQSVATYADAASISASTSPAAGSPPTSSSASAASAFDRVRRTAWTVGGTLDPEGSNPTGASLTVELRKPQDVGSISVLPSEQPRQIKAVDVITRSEDGGRARMRLRFRGGPGTRAGRRIDVTNVSSVKLRIVRVSPGSGAVGIAEVAVRTPHGPLDLREFVRTPSDLATRAASDQRLGAALAARPPRYELRRVVGVGTEDEETELRREIVAFGDHRYDVSIRARVDGRTAESAVDTLLGAPVGAVGTSRFGRSLGGRGGLAVDNHVSTAWEPEPQVGERLHLHFPNTKVRKVEVLVVSGTMKAGIRSRVTGVQVSVGDGRPQQTARSTLPRSPRCAHPKPPQGGCLETHVVHVRPTEADQLSVTLTGLTRLAGPFGPVPPSVVEVRVNGRDWSEFRDSTPRHKCVPLLAVDGAPVDVRLPPHPHEVLAGKQLELNGCQQVRLSPGMHRIETLPGLSGAVLTTSLVPHGWNDVSRADRHRPGEPGTVQLVDQSPTSSQLLLDAPKGALLIGGMPWHQGWAANSDQLAPSPLPLNTFAAWTVESHFSGPVTLYFQPQRIYELAMALSIAAAAWCLWRVTRRRKRDPR